MKSVRVELPVVKLRVDDLSYLKHLSDKTPESVPCVPVSGKSSRLRILGLIEDKEINPCPKALAEFQKKRSETLLKIRQAIKSEKIDWETLNNLSMYRCTDSQSPKKRTITVVTPAGRALLRRGVSQVQVVAACK